MNLTYDVRKPFESYLSEGGGGDGGVGINLSSYLWIRHTPHPAFSPSMLLRCVYRNSPFPLRHVPHDL